VVTDFSLTPPHKLPENGRWEISYRSWPRRSGGRANHVTFADRNPPQLAASFPTVDKEKSAGVTGHSQIAAEMVLMAAEHWGANDACPCRDAPGAEHGKPEAEPPRRKAAKKYRIVG
jgi:hypothetical protein